jgi:hypothetical protein
MKLLLPIGKRKRKMSKIMTIEEIDQALESLRKQSASINRKTTILWNKRQKLAEEQDTLISSQIPEDYMKVSKEQWKWILYKDNQESMTKHTFQENFLHTNFGFNTMGYWHETNQCCLTIYDAEKTRLGIKILKKYLKPVTFTNSITEIGIPFQIFDINEDSTSILYLYEDDTTVLYEDRWSNPKKFKNYDAFIDWYIQFKKNKEKEYTSYNDDEQ